MPMPPPSYAGFWRRLAAGILDLLIFSIGSSTMLYAFHGPAYLFASGDAAYPVSELLVGNVLPILLTLALWTGLGGTPGKLLMGCVIADAASGRRIGWRRAVIRLLGYVLSALPLGLGFLWIGWDDRKRGFHDRLAGTVVIIEDYAREAVEAMAREVP